MTCNLCGANAPLVRASEVGIAMICEVCRLDLDKAAHRRDLIERAVIAIEANTAFEPDDQTDSFDQLDVQVAESCIRAIALVDMIEKKLDGRPTDARTT